MKIALLTSTFLPSIGGVEVGLHCIACNLLNVGITPVVVAPFSSRNIKLPYKVIVLPPKIFQLYKYIPMYFADIIFSFIYYLIQKKYKFDVWHITMGYPAGVSFVMFSRKYNIPYFIRCAGSDIQISNVGNYGVRRNRRIDNIVKRKLNSATYLVSISESVRNEYLKLQIVENKIINISNGVDLSLFESLSISKYDIYDKYGISHNMKIFLSVGRNHDKKNFKLLFDVAQNLINNKYDKFIFLIVGDNSKDLSKYITDKLKTHFLLLESFSLDYNYDVPLLPHRELVSIYKASDLFIFPSFIETFGIVLIEAMAAGLPIITSNVEGCRDLVKNDKNGFLCNPNCSYEFSNRIIQLMTNSSLYREFSENNLIMAKDYDWSKITHKYINLYKKILNQKNVY